MISFCRIRNSGLTFSVLRCFHTTWLSKSAEKWTSNGVRSTFMDYFSTRHGYQPVPSSSIIPQNDKSLLFVNAGMNQFKPIFLGALEKDDPRCNLKLVVNSQKCIRAGGKHNDLSEVGRDGTHHTFFEMLGNWAFNGSVTKMEACRQALQLLTDVYGLSKNRLFVTYFNGDRSIGLPEDSECKDAWLRLGFNDDRIFGLGMSENFWEMAVESGPCGPCAEIMYSKSEPPSMDKSTEIWNLVFMSYQKMGDGELTPLPSMHLDTGMGLERLCCILQDVQTNYETDLFWPILEQIRMKTGAPMYKGLFGDQDPKRLDTSYRILADHARMFTVAISDGVQPTATSMGGVLRRIIRNAAYQSMLIWSNTPKKNRKDPLQLADLCDVVATILGDAYPELWTNLPHIRQVVQDQQKKFDKLIQKTKTDLGFMLKERKRITSNELFSFYEQSGLPQDIIMEMVKKWCKDMDKDEFREVVNGFDRLMDEKKKISREKRIVNE